MRKDFEAELSLPTWQVFHDEAGEFHLELDESVNEGQELVLALVDGGPSIVTKNKMMVEEYERLQQQAEKYDGYYVTELTVKELVEAVLDLMDVQAEVRN